MHACLHAACMHGCRGPARVPACGRGGVGARIGLDRMHGHARHCSPPARMRHGHTQSHACCFCTPQGCTHIMGSTHTTGQYTHSSWRGCAAPLTHMHTHAWPHTHARTRMHAPAPASSPPPHGPPAAWPLPGGSRCPCAPGSYAGGWGGGAKGWWVAPLSAALLLELRAGNRRSITTPSAPVNCPADQQLHKTKCN